MNRFNMMMKQVITEAIYIDENHVKCRVKSSEQNVIDANFLFYELLSSKDKMTNKLFFINEQNHGLCS